MEILKRQLVDLEIIIIILAFVFLFHVFFFFHIFPFFLSFFLSNMFIRCNLNLRQCHPFFMLLSDGSHSQVLSCHSFLSILSYTEKPK